ncbi:MAG: hypothetical protein QXH80_00905 [Candidatus Nanoarchaeia archaeon]
MVKNTVSMIQEIGVPLDEMTLKVLNILEKGKVVPENAIAGKLKLKINATRKYLYQLSSRGLAVYTKQRDPKKKWWYLYFWSLDIDKIKALYLDHLLKKLQQKRAELEAEQQFAFECQSCQRKYKYEDSLETDFSCPACSSILVEARPTKIILRLRREIETIEKELEVLAAQKEKAKEAEAKQKIKAKPKPKPKAKPKKSKKKRK